MQDMTTGPVRGHLLRVAGFIFATMIFSMLYYLVDLYFIGKVSKEAVAAVSLAGNLMFLVLAATQVLSVGATALISHATGRKDREETILLFNQSQVLSLIVGILFFVACFFSKELYVNKLAADAATAEQGIDYLRWFIPAMSVQFALVAMGSALRATGNLKPSMVMSVGSVLLNIILAPILILGWGTGRPFGAAGAGIASLIAIVAGGIGLTIYFISHEKFLEFRLHDSAPRFSMWWRMLKIGIPAGTEFALMSVYLFIVYLIIRPFGSSAQAGFGIGMRILQFFFLPALAIGFALAPVAGQNFGARRPDRIRESLRQAAILVSGAMLVLTALCHIAPAGTVGLLSDDPEVIRIGAEYLNIISYNFIASGLVFISGAMFQALGNTLPSLLASAIRLLAFAVPAIWLSVQPSFKLEHVWYFSVASIVFQAALSWFFLRREMNRELASMQPAAPEAVVAST